MTDADPEIDITVTVQTEGVDEAVDALEDLADAAERVREALDDLSVQVDDREIGEEFGEALKAELATRGELKGY